MVPIDAIPFELRPEKIIDAFSREDERIERAQKLSGNSAHGSRLEKYGKHSPVKANRLMRFPVRAKRSFGRKRCLAAMHGPPRSHEPRIR